MNRFAFALHANSNQLSPISQAQWICSALGVRVLWLNNIRKKKQTNNIGVKQQKNPSLIDMVKDSCWHILFIALASNRHFLQFLSQYAWGCDVNELEPFQWSRFSHVCKYAFIYATIFIFLSLDHFDRVLLFRSSIGHNSPAYLFVISYLFIYNLHPMLFDVMGIWSNGLVNYVLFKIVSPLSGAWATKHNKNDKHRQICIK